MIIPKRGTTRVQNGKGSTYRPVNDEVYKRNYDRIFGKRKIKLWRPGKLSETPSSTTHSK